MTTPKDFALALLSGLGLPESQNNIDAIVSAEAAEGGFMNNTANFNPLNVTTKVAGSQLAAGWTPGVGPQIQSYPDWPTGLQATISTLKNGYYPDILASLAASADPQTTLNVWAKNPKYGWDHVPTVNTAYGNYSFPTSAKMGSFPVGAATSSSMTSPIVKLGLLGGILYALYRALPVILK